MYQLATTPVFDKWLARLKRKNRQAHGVVTNYISRLALGNSSGDKALGDGVWEKKVDFGPGYRLYYCRYGKLTLLLLLGGDKSTQSADIRQVKQLKKEIK